MTSGNQQSSQRLFNKTWLSEKLSRMPQVPLPYIVYPAILVSGLVIVAYVLRASKENLTYERILSFATPAIIGTLSLLIGLLARNVSISDRIRSLGKELSEARFKGIQPSKTRARFSSIDRQLQDFHFRYRLNVYSLIFISLNLIVLPGLVLTFPTTLSEVPETPSSASGSVAKEALDTTELRSESDENKGKPPVAKESPKKISNLTFAILVASSFLYTIAGLMCALDIWLSFVTLELDLEYSFLEIDSFAVAKDEIDDEATDVVVHFSNLFHRVWNDERIDAVAKFELNDAEATRRVETAFSKYFSLHQEEFHFFQNGLIPERMYRQWIVHLQRQAFDGDVGTNSTIRSHVAITLVDWWSAHKAEFFDLDFVEMIDRLMIISVKKIKQVVPPDLEVPYSIDEILEFVRDKAVKLNP